MSKLIVSEIESTGTSVQINDDLKVGSTGTNLITSGNVVGPSEDMIKNFKAFENPITVYDAAVSSTGVPGFTNAVPHVTSTSTGLTTGTALAATSTGNSLLTNFSADAVYVYNSSGTANCKNDYWGATIDIPKAFRGQNIVLSFDYRTEAASTNVTGEDQWFVAVQDKTNTVAFLVTATALVAAGSAVGVVSSTGLAVGDKVWLEGGGNAQGHVSNSITEAYITEVTDSTNIKLSQDYTPASTANSIGQTGFLTNTLQFLAAADSDTDKVGKNRKLAFKTADDTAQVNVFFQLRNTSSTVVHSLYFDNVYISSNKFLQASSQTKSESYSAARQVNFWDASGATEYEFNIALLLPIASSPSLAESKLVEVVDESSKTLIKARQAITLSALATASLASSAYIEILDKDDNVLARDQQFNSGNYESAVSVTINLNKGDYIYFHSTNFENRTGGVTFTATSQTSDVVILESQDEIFTSWTAYTPTWAGITPGFANFYWRRIGDSMEIKGAFDGGSLSGTEASLTIPSGYSINQTLHANDNGNDTVGYYFRGGSSISYHGGSMLSQSTESGKLYFDYGSFSSGSFDPLAVSTTGFMATGNEVVVYASIPISGWNANFNPVLSMPLVEIGTDVGAYGGELGTPASTYRQWVELEETNTLGSSGLGTLTKGSSTSAFSFTASVDCIVNFSYSCGSPSSHDETGIISGPSSVPIADSTKSFVNTDYDGYRKSQGWIWAGDENPDNIATTFVMNAGDTMQLATTQSGAAYYGGASRTFSMVAQRIRQNTTMAHIIKPAVAYAKDIRVSTDNGGGTVHGAWRKRDLQTLEGETWFMTLSSHVITLDPGTYKIKARYLIARSDAVASRLYSTTDSATLAVGETGQVGSGDYISQEIECLKTFTASHSFELQYQSQTTAGGTDSARALGMNSAASGSTESWCAASVRVEKLK